MFIVCLYFKIDPVELGPLSRMLRGGGKKYLSKMNF